MAVAPATGRSERLYVDLESDEIAKAIRQFVREEGDRSPLLRSNLCTVPALPAGTLGCDALRRCCCVGRPPSMPTVHQQQSGEDGCCCCGNCWCALCVADRASFVKDYCCCESHPLGARGCFCTTRIWGVPGEEVGKWEDDWANCVDRCGYVICALPLPLLVPAWFLGCCLVGCACGDEYVDDCGQKQSCRDTCPYPFEAVEARLKGMRSDNPFHQSSRLRAQRQSKEKLTQSKGSGIIDGQPLGAGERPSSVIIPLGISLLMHHCGTEAYAPFFATQHILYEKLLLFDAENFAWAIRTEDPHLPLSRVREIAGRMAGAARQFATLIGSIVVVHAGEMSRQQQNQLSERQQQESQKQEFEMQQQQQQPGSSESTPHTSSNNDGEIGPSKVVHELLDRRAHFVPPSGSADASPRRRPVITLDLKKVPSQAYLQALALSARVVVLCVGPEFVSLLQSSNAEELIRMTRDQNRCRVVVLRLSPQVDLGESVGLYPFTKTAEIPFSSSVLPAEVRHFDLVGDAEAREQAFASLAAYVSARNIC
eukprot:m.129782 g.129782  ORF g.129782 m.129782 type:complete len:539 (-) comp16418_c0_seq2:236-1852(-)